MQSADNRRIFTNFALAAGLGIAGLYAAGRWVLPWLWPFLIARAAAAALEPLAGRLCRRGWKRPIAAGVCLLGTLTAAFGLLWLLADRAAAELGELLPRLPDLLAEATGTVRGWKSALDGWSDRAPGELGLWLGQAVSGLTERLGALPGELAGKLPGILSGLAAAAPSALLFSATAVIGTYFISASYPELLHGAPHNTPIGRPDETTAARQPVLKHE